MCIRDRYITKVTNGKLVLAHTTSIEDTYYPDEVDYTTQSFKGDGVVRIRGPRPFFKLLFVLISSLWGEWR